MNSSDGSVQERARGWNWSAAAAAAGLLFLTLAGLAVRGQDPTLDERFYFGAGREILTSGEWKGRGPLLHPPLGYYVSSLPLFLFAEPSFRQPLPLLLSRLTSLAVFALPLLAVLYAWARERDGPAAGALALALAAGSPTLRAHAALITPDWPFTATSLLALFLYWRAELREDRPRVGGPLGWGAALGLSLLAKGAAWLVVGSVGILSGIAAIRRRSWSPLRRLGAALAAAWLVLQLGYGFSGWLDCEGKAALLAKVPQQPMVRAVAGVAAGMFPLPYLKSMATQLHVAQQGLPAFLMGELSSRGFPHYFVVALLVKETIPLLVMLLAACVVLRRAPRDGDLALLLLPLLLILVFSLGKIQIGIRYLLPAFPLLFVHASRLVGLAAEWGRPARLTLAALVLLHLASGLRAWPDDIAYFNEVAGGPAGGWRWLVDSNLDWDQNRTRMLAQSRVQGWIVEPLVLPPTGRIVLGANRVQGIFDRSRYRRLREEYEPVARAGYNFLVFDLEQPKHPGSARVRVESGEGWKVTSAAVGDAARLLDGQESGFVPEREYPGTQARLMGCASDEDGCWLRRSFVLERRAVQAVLHLATRDSLELHANGRLSVALSCSPGFEKLERRLESELRPGRNELSLKLASCGSRPLSGVFLELGVTEAVPQ